MNPDNPSPTTVVGRVNGKRQFDTPATADVHLLAVGTAFDRKAYWIDAVEVWTLLTIRIVVVGNSRDNNSGTFRS